MSAKTKKTRFAQKEMSPKDKKISKHTRSLYKKNKTTRSKSMKSILRKHKRNKTETNDKENQPKRKKKTRNLSLNFRLKKKKVKNSLSVPNHQKERKSHKKKKKKKTKSKLLQKRKQKSNSTKTILTSKQNHKETDRFTKKDIQTAKNRLHKRRESIKKKDITPLNHDHKITKKSSRKSKKPHSKYTDKDLWNDYISTYGNAPRTYSYLQNFSKTNEHHKTLTYKESQTIFNKFSTQTADDATNKSSNMKEKRPSFIERDIQHAKRRLSQTMSRKKQKKISFVNTVNEKQFDLNSIDEKSDALQPTMAQIKAFLESERIYVYDGLRVGYDTFLCRLQAHNQVKKPILSDTEIQSIFRNYQIIYNINNQLYDDLKALKLNIAIDKIIYNLGKKMVDFIPYFKMYTDYIVNKTASLLRLEHMKKKNKAFKEFVKLNELCCKKKLKTLLEEPAHRVPQYLQYLVGIYASYKHESDANSKGSQLLLQSIADIKTVSDSIATRCHDIQSRTLVGSLQKDLFGNKIKLLSPHRLCIAHSSTAMLLPNKEKMKQYKCILFNDMFLISSFASRFKSAHMVAVHPLIGLRISLHITVHLGWLTSKPYKFALLPSNTILIFEDEQNMKKWMDLIQHAVDKQEHSFKQCNVVDLEKRVRKQKTSIQGRSETVTITNPHKLKEIERWKTATNYKYNNALNTSNLPLIPSLSLTSANKPKKRNARSRTMPGLNRNQKDLLSKIIAMGPNNDDCEEKEGLNVPSSTLQSSSRSMDGTKVRVMRDEEVLELDEEIPLENFMKALNSGFVKITNDNEQDEQYKKAAEKARTLVRHSLGNYRRYVTGDIFSFGDDDDSDSDWDSSDDSDTDTDDDDDDSDSDDDDSDDDNY